MRNLGVPAAIAANGKNGNSWRLENEVLRADIEFDSSDGRIDMTGFYNKKAGKDYLTGSGDRNLFKYGTIEEDENSHDKAENLMFTVNCDEAEKIKYFGNGWVGGASLRSTCEANDYFEFLFKGTAIEYHAATAHSGGLTAIYVDGELVDIVDMRAPIEDGEIDRLVYANYSLSDGLHMFKAIHRRNENKDGQSSMNISHIRYGRVDSRTIYAPQEEIAVIDGATVTRFITPSFEAIEVDHTDPAVTYSKPNEWQKWQVTHSYTNTPGEYAEYTFTGTGIKVYGVKAQNRGMMDVFIDDEFRKRVDMYYDKQLEPTLVFDSGSLQHGQHTIKLVNSGKNNSLSSGTLVSLSKFVVISQTPSDSKAEINPEITLNGVWHGSGSTVSVAKQGSSFELEFTGTFFEWHGTAGPDRGAAEVYIDGVKLADVNMHSDIPIEKIVYRRLDLSNGRHKLKVVSLGANLSVTKVVFGQSPVPAVPANLVCVSASGGGWTLEGSSIKDIELYDTHWGKRLSIDISRARPAMTVTLVFEIYDGRAGLRYNTFIKNDNSEKELRIAQSDIISLNFPVAPHLIHYVPVMNEWSTAQSLAKARRNAVTLYDSGDGWSINPENNWATSLESGGFVADHLNTLLYMDVFNDNNDVKVYSNPIAVQLVLFPNERHEYFGVNMSVFAGDDIDGRMAIEEHFHKRYKYADPTRRISTNNWGYQKTGIYSVYSAWLPHFNDVVIPAAVAANLDAIHFDHFWTGVGSFYDIDSAQWISDITDDPVAFVQKVNEAGLKFGLWFSPTGGFWGEGRDFADLSVFDGKIAQFEDYILNPDQYNAKWVQFDYGIFWKKSEVTPYSHPTDSVFRKYINAREFTQRFTHKDSDLFVQMTCEVDNPSWSTPQGVALLHIADNSLAGMYERTVYRDAAKDCFSAFGLLPMNSTLSTWGAWDYWSDKVEYFYQFLLARHSSIYTDPVFWGADGIAVLKEFNNWRKNPRMESVLNELFRPVYSGSNLSGPLVWMYTDEFKEKAIVAAIGSTGGTSVPEVNLRWLDDNKTYLIEDISLLDGGKAQGHLAKFDYRFVGKKTGAQLKEEGFKINFETNYSDGKAYWIQEFKPVMQQVIYADSAVCAYDETWDGDTLNVNITDGIPDAAATVIAYKEYAQNTEVKEIVLDAQGHGQVTFAGATVTEPLPLLKRKKTDRKGGFR